jgi:hypothetical protein
MSLAENVSAQVAYKAYATGVITANTQPTSSSDPGATSAQVLRRVTSTLKLGKETYSSNEVRPDRQIADFRHGVKRAQGGIVSGEFSPGTYWDFFEAVLRTDEDAPITASQSDFTSVSADNTAGTFTFTAGNPLTKGFRIGSIVRFTNLSDADNNTRNFLIVAMGGTTGRIWTVWPKPDTMTADSAFSVAEIGKSLFAPSSGFVSRKFAIEHYFSDIDIARLFTEVRVDGFNLQLPASGLATIDFTGMGRDMEVYTGGSAPFFTSPTAAGTTGLAAAVNGVLYFQGTRVGVCTGLSVQAALGGSSPAVVGQNFVPEVFLNSLNITGQASILLEDATFINYFKNETEVSLLAYLTSNSDNNSPAASIYLPRIKLGDADAPLSGDTGIVQTCPFQALKGPGTVAGDEATTIRIHDTQAV